MVESKNAMLMQSRAFSWQVGLALIVVQILFGMNYVASKLIVNNFPPLVWASIRNLGSAGVLFILLSFKRVPPPPYSLPFFRSLCLFSFLGILLNQGAFLLGLQYTSATHHSILSTCIPLLTLLINILTGREVLTRTRWIGFIFALLGVLTISNVENFSFSNQTVWGDALILLSSISYAIFLVFSQHFLRSYSIVWITAWLFGVGGIGLGIISIPEWIFLSGFHQWKEPHVIAAMLFSTFGCTLMAYFLNFWALSQTRVSAVALFIYLQPVVASLLAYLFLGEVLTGRAIFSSMMILIGMILALDVFQWHQKEIM